jgi:hypothetical protein
MCVEVYERTFVTVQHLVAAQKFTKMWTDVYERPFVNVPGGGLRNFYPGWCDQRYGVFNSYELKF